MRLRNYPQVRNLMIVFDNFSGKDIGKTTVVHNINSTQTAKQSKDNLDALLDGEPNVELGTESNSASIDSVIINFGTMLRKYSTKGLLETVADAIVLNESIESLTLTSMAHARLCKDEVTLLAEALTINDTIKSLALVDMGLTGTTMKALAHGIRHNKGLVAMDVSGNSMGDVGAAFMISALKENKTIRQLSLRGCGLTVDSVCRLLTSLSISGGIDEIDLSGNCVGDKGAAILSNMMSAPSSTLTKIAVSDAQITQQGGIALANGLAGNPVIKYLDVSGNAVGTNQIGKIGNALSLNKTLTYLNVSDTGFESTGLESTGLLKLQNGLENHPALVRIDLDDNKLNGEDCISFVKTILQKNDTLMHMSIQGTYASAEDLVRLYEAAIESRGPENMSLDLLSDQQKVLDGCNICSVEKVFPSIFAVARLPGGFDDARSMDSLSGPKKMGQGVHVITAGITKIDMSRYGQVMPVKDVLYTTNEGEQEEVDTNKHRIHQDVVKALREYRERMAEGDMTKEEYQEKLNDVMKTSFVNAVETNQTKDGMEWNDTSVKTKMEAMKNRAMKRI